MTPKDILVAALVWPALFWVIVALWRVDRRRYHAFCSAIRALHHGEFDTPQHP